MQSSFICSGKWSLPVMLIVDLSLTRVVQHSPFQFKLCLAYTRVVSQIDGAVRAYTHAHDDHYLTHSKFNSLLTEMITPQTYIYTYKTASCTSCIRGSLRLAPNYIIHQKLILINTLLVWISRYSLINMVIESLRRIPEAVVCRAATLII